MVLLPADEYQEIKEISRLTREIYNRLMGDSPREVILNEFISEQEAKKLLNRKTTWFWNQRQSGRLDFKKMGSTVYYRKDDLLNLLNA